MECNEVRKEFPEIHFPQCCESCHDDDDRGYGNDLWFEIGWQERNVCCAIMNAFVRYRKDIDK